MNKLLWKPILMLVLFLLTFQINFLMAQTYATFEDSINNYTLKCPSCWKVSKTPNSRNLIKASFDKDDKTGLQVRIYDNKNTFKSFVDWYVNDFIKQMTGHHSGKMDIKEKKYSTINGNEVFYFSIDFTNGKKEKWFIKQYLFPKENKIYVLQAGTPFDKQGIDEPVIDHIARSFRFLK